jgi:co-chaperonin GroES (HSP10)
MPTIRAYADNVILEWVPEPDLAPDGIIFMPQNRKPEKTRKARVIASGPGYFRDGGHGAFIPNEVCAGDIVLVDRQAGQNYSLDLYKPRVNATEAVYGEGRIVRHDEILGVVEEEP